MKGRPSIYTQELIDDLCERISHGDSLRQICADDAMPALTTVRRWLAEKEDFRLQYARARDDQADYYADEIIEIADNQDLKPDDKRVRIDARKWKASKLAPKKYGDKVALVGGGEGDEPIKQSITVEFVGANRSTG